MIDICREVINWLQVLTVSSVMLNFVLAGICGVCVHEMRKQRFRADSLDVSKKRELRAR